jgi:hypothetical protein
VKTFLSYALSIGGLGFVIAAVIGASMVNLSYPAARMRLYNMMQQSLNKAEIMCRAAKGTFFEPVGAAIKVAALAQSRDITVLQMATRPSYDASCMPVTLHWKALFGRGKKGVLLVVAGVAVAIGVKANPAFHIIVAVATGIAAAWFMYTKAENERSLRLARAEILPAVEQAFADGKWTQYG